MKMTVFVHSDSGWLVCFFDIAEHSWALSHDLIIDKFSPKASTNFGQ